MTARRVYLSVAACAVVVYLGTLRDGFTLDDGHIIAGNALVHLWSGLWRAFGSPYWPPAFGGTLYRPLPVASYALDWRLGGVVAWFHAVNLLWHAAASVLVAVAARRWAGEKAALVAGLLFAVHPVHVEAVTNVVGRAELMAATFTLLAVYGALTGKSVWWSTLAWVLGLLSKENAVVAPALIAAGWAAGLGDPPGRKRMTAFAAAWVLAGAAYLTLRGVVLHPYAGLSGPAPVFIGQSAGAVRLTAVAAFADVLRLLVWPLTLRVDYSPDERTIVTSCLDGRFLLGLLVFGVWVALLVLAWRRKHRVEWFGLAWIGIAYLPVANLLFPIGVLTAERTLYLPSVGLAIAAGAFLARLPVRGLGVVVALIVVAGGIRSALRVPIWRDNLTVTLSLLEDSPRSYQGPMATAGIYLEGRQWEKALDAARVASAIYPLDARPYLIGAHAALKLGLMPSADSLLSQADRHCFPCAGVYGAEIAVARSLGDTAIADSLAAHLHRRGGP